MKAGGVGGTLWKGRLSLSSGDENSRGEYPSCRPLQPTMSRWLRGRVQGRFHVEARPIRYTDLTGPFVLGRSPTSSERRVRAPHSTDSTVEEEDFRVGT